MLVAAGHRHGWPVAEGGSRAITTALAGLLVERGGRIECGVPVRSSADLPAADVTLFDTTPQAVAQILGTRMGAGRRRAYQRYRFGPGVFKVDLAVRGDVGWTNPEARRAGTVHLGGTGEEVAAAEAAVVAGRMPRRPFVLVGQQYLADPTRSADGVNPVWAYAHVPAGHRGDLTDLVVDQIEAAAPGVRDRIVAASPPTPKVATPPGAGVHGMSGAGAAASALRSLGLSVGD